ncbi:hypothetical protein LG3211_4069 [Lysobacter gummosus]|nr:hypothetical protein LG3211_4069 [Lysobacter gummosus]
MGRPDKAGPAPRRGPQRARHGARSTQGHPAAAAMPASCRSPPALCEARRPRSAGRKKSGTLTRSHS